MRQTFNPDDWSDENEDDSQQPSNLSGFQKPDWFNDSDDIDRVVSRIEAMQTDITGSYADWRNLGFALADELDVTGAAVFNRNSNKEPETGERDMEQDAVKNRSSLHVPEMIELPGISIPISI